MAKTREVLHAVCVIKYLPYVHKYLAFKYKYFKMVLDYYCHNDSSISWRNLVA